MKFAKTLQESMHEGWCDKYIDYKQMKKILKRSDGDVMQFFCDMYEAQIVKVQQFMCGQQLEIMKSIRPLELDLECESDAERKHELGSHCQRLVQDLEWFRDYVSLNIIGMRKIIKKFDKRFQLRYHDVFGAPQASSMLVSERDIGMLQLFPAKQCLKLMRLAVEPVGVIDRPLRQYTFWVEELRAGSEVARCRVGGASSMDKTSLRLGMRGEKEELGLCIKNTFIDYSTTEAASSPTSRRASSEPCREPLVFIKECNPEDTAPTTASAEAEAEELICAPLQVGPVSRGCESGFCHMPLPISISLAEGAIHSSEPGTAIGQRLAIDEDISVKATSSPELMQNAEAHSPKQAKAKPVTRSGDASAVRGRSGSSSTDMTSSSSSSARWWTQALTSMTCPVSGFPISMLPYPPYKFHMRTGNPKEQPVLVDGPYLCLQVLSTWNFEVLGRLLLPTDVAALDAYMKRCKLGPFRLGRAMDILAVGTHESNQEFSKLQEQARRKLAHLRQVQTFRRDGQEPSQPKSQARPKQRQKQPPAQKQPPPT